MAVTPLTSLSQFNSIVNANRVAVIYFWAYWCGPCRGMTPIFDGAADSGSHAGVDFYRVDIDQANDIVQQVGGQTVRLFVRELAYNKAHPLMRVSVYAQIPGFYVYQRGQKLGELIGACPAELQNLFGTATTAAQSC